MSERDPTRIGRVRQVRGSRVTVVLDAEMAGTSPIYRGKVRSIGEVGSLVRIPQGLVDLIARVAFLGISEAGESSLDALEVGGANRWVEVELIGELDRGTGRFERGVGTYPALEDQVHFATAELLEAIFPSPGEARIRLGSLSADGNVPVSLEAEPLVVRHATVVGSTGSGKTSAVASLLQNFVRGGWKASNILVFDPHGEYSAALEGVASVRSVLGETGRLRVPYWALPADRILQIFMGTKPAGKFRNRFHELVARQKRNFSAKAEWLDLIPSAVTPDTPIPFDIREVWFQLDSENRETRTKKKDPSTVCVEEEGSAADLQPTKYEPYGPSGTPPNKGPRFGDYQTSPERLRLGLLDPRLAFFLEPLGDATGTDPLVDVIQEWLGGQDPITVLDLSGVPSRAADAAVGVILDLLFELAVRSDADGPGIGRPSPVLVVLEEAHRYMGNQASGLTKDAANRIAREGRKYGVGLMAVTQRPTELPKTALAQSGTIIALRLSNSADQGTIQAALPDTVSGLAEVLPSLRTHEAIICGDAIELPVRALVDQPSPWPEANDPSLDPWRLPPKDPEVETALKSWRDTYQ